MEDIGKMVMEQLMPVFGLLLVALTTWAMELMRRKLGLQVTAGTQSLIRQSVRRGIGAAEEWAERKLKLEPGKDPGGAAKLSYVLDLVTKQWPKLGEHEIVRIVDEELARIKGVGATGDKTFEA